MVINVVTLNLWPLVVVGNIVLNVVSFHNIHDTVTKILLQDTVVTNCVYYVIIKIINVKTYEAHNVGNEVIFLLTHLLPDNLNTVMSHLTEPIIEKTN